MDRLKIRLMQSLPASATDQDISRVVERWIDDLVEGRYDVAFERTSHDPYYNWTPDLMHSVVQGYGLPRPHRRGPFEVTDRMSAAGHPAFEVEREETPPEIIAFVSHNLPLNGEWSDLTVTFRLESRGDHCELILEEIHVF